jgi:site-specific recombinase XerD
MLHEVTRRDVLDVLDRIVDAGAPVVANRVLAAVRRLFSWAIGRDIIAISPCAGVRPPSPETSRDRT